MSVFKTWDLWRQAYAAAGYVDDEEQDMTTLREAAAQALEALGLWATGRDMDAVVLNDLIAGLEAALEQYDKDRVRIEELKANWALQRKLAKETQERDKQRLEYEAALSDGDNLSPPEPVAWMDIADDGTRLAVRMYSDGSSEEVPLYLGCDHCNHPLYAAIKCRQCGRVTG